LQQNTFLYIIQHLTHFVNNLTAFFKYFSRNFKQKKNITENTIKIIVKLLQEWYTITEKQVKDTYVKKPCTKN